jgi:hypothetical protein
MAKKTKAVVIETLQSVITALSDAIGGVYDQTSIVTQVCNACSSYFNGADASKAQVNEIAQGVAEQRNWSEKSAKPRKSEVRAIVRAYRRLPNVCQTIAAEAESFTWHNAVKVARLINSNPKLGDDAIVKKYASEAASKKAAKSKSDLDTMLAWFEKLGDMAPRAQAAKDLHTKLMKAFSDAGYELNAVE